MALRSWSWPSAVFVFLRFVPESAAMQFAEHVPWMPALGISYHLAVDGISVLFVGLTAFLTVLIVIYSWDTVRHQVKLYMMALLALETTTMGIFVSIDLILFFVFWELMLIPSYFLIKLWGGGAERHYAALKFVLYTLLGSVFMLVGIALLDINYHQWAIAHHVEPTYSFDLLELLSVPIPLSQQILIFWLMFLGFAFKAPVFPFHTWLPDALVEGPIGMAVMLAGIETRNVWIHPVQLSVASRRLEKPDRRRSHHGAGTRRDYLWGDHGADPARLPPSARVQQHQPPGLCGRRTVRLELSRAPRQPAHHDQFGIQYGGLVFHRGLSLPRQQSTQLAAFGGMAKQMPLLATFFLIIGLASIGLPGTNGFVGEFLILLGAFKAKWWYGAIAVAGVIFGAAYFLWYYERVDAGPLGKAVKDSIERSAYPRNDHRAGLVGHDPLDRPLSRPFLRMMNGSVQALVDRLDRGTVASIEPQTADTGRLVHAWVNTHCSISCLPLRWAPSR